MVVKSCPSIALSLLKSSYTVVLRVLLSGALSSITACFTTISHLTRYYSSAFTLILGICPVTCCLYFLTFSAYSLSLKTTFILSPGPGRRNSIFSPSVTFTLSNPLCNLSFTTTKSVFSAFVLPVSILIARSSLRVILVGNCSFWLGWFFDVC
jgi:hypothetical protein